jgi:hypothetical protein
VYETSAATSLVPRLWAVEAIQRLLGTAADPDAIRGKIVSMGMEYGLMTPYTSFIARESEQAYQQRGIRRNRSRLQGVRLTSLPPATEPQMVAEVLGLTLGVAFGCTRDEAPPASAPVLGAKRAMEPMAQQRPTSVSRATPSAPWWPSSSSADPPSTRWPAAKAGSARWSA